MAPEGAGRALRGYVRSVRTGGNPKETAKSTGRLDKEPPGISGHRVRLPGGRPSPWGCGRDVGWRRYARSQRQAEKGRDGGRTGRWREEGGEPRREFKVLYFFYVPSPLREEIPMAFRPLSSKNKTSITLLNNEL